MFGSLGWQELLIVFVLLGPVVLIGALLVRALWRLGNRN
jgi:hypothetical protein